MEKVAQNTVGIDYHSEVVQVCILDVQGETLLNERYPNDISSIKKAIKEQGPASIVAVEASTGSARFLDELVVGESWKGKLCHPGYVNRMRHNPDKTDHSDGELVADLARVGYLPEVWLAPENIRDLRALVRYRYQLVQHTSSIKLRIRAMLREWRIKPTEKLNLWTNRGLLWLTGAAGKLPTYSGWVMQRHLTELKDAIQRVYQAERKLAQVAKGDTIAAKLMSFKGIGLITAMTLRSEIGDFQRFRSGKQLARFCGVTPRNASSGSRQADAGLIKAGNPHLKTALIECSQLLARYDSRWNAFSSRLLAAGKPKCVVVAAVVNRWIRWLYHQMVVPMSATLH